MAMIKLLIVFIFGCCVGCAVTGDRDSQPFDTSVRVSQVETGLWSVRFTRLEVGRPHGLFTRPRKVLAESWLYVERREGFNDVRAMKYGSLPDAKSPFAERSLPFRGGATLTDEKVSVAIFFTTDGKAWTPFEYNGEYQIESK